MPMMPGKTALLELLKQEGVRVMFGNPGTTELPLMDALAAEHELRYVLALQEAPAMGMADGYAQASGQLACVNLHAAPGRAGGRRSHDGGLVCGHVASTVQVAGFGPSSFFTCAIAALSELSSTARHALSVAPPPLTE